MAEPCKDFNPRVEGFQALANPNSPSAIYCLRWKGEVVYVGKAKQIYQRFTSHYNAKRLGQRGSESKSFRSDGDVSGIPIPFDEVWIKFVPPNEITRLELELIHKLKPRFNLQICQLPPEYSVDLSQFPMLKPTQTVPWNSKNRGSYKLRRRVA